MQVACRSPAANSRCRKVLQSGHGASPSPILAAGCRCAGNAPRVVARAGAARVDDGIGLRLVALAGDRAAGEGARIGRDQRAAVRKGEGARKIQRSRQGDGPVEAVDEAVRRGVEMARAGRGDGIIGVDVDGAARTVGAHVRLRGRGAEDDGCADADRCPGGAVDAELGAVQRQSRQVEGNAGAAGRNRGCARDDAAVGRRQVAPKREGPVVQHRRGDRRPDRPGPVLQLDGDVVGRGVDGHGCRNGFRNRQECPAGAVGQTVIAVGAVGPDVIGAVRGQDLANVPPGHDLLGMGERECGGQEDASRRSLGPQCLDPGGTVRRDLDAPVVIAGELEVGTAGIAGLEEHGGGVAGRCLVDLQPVVAGFLVEQRGGAPDGQPVRVVGGGADADESAGLRLCTAASIQAAPSKATRRASSATKASQPGRGARKTQAPSCQAATCPSRAVHAPLATAATI